MTTEEFAWIAGIVEGEGCIDANQDGSARLRVEMTDEDVIRRLHSISGVGTVRRDDRNQRRNSSWSISFVWSVCRRDDLRALLAGIRPWMGQRRGAKIDTFLAPVKEVCYSS